MANAHVTAGSYPPEMPPPTSPPANTSAKRRPGRPSNADRQAEAAAKAAQPPAPDESKRDPFRLFIPAMKPEDWRTHMIYLYRLGPITDRRGPGRAKHVMKYSEAIDEDRVMHEHGSGRYRAEMVFFPPEGGGSRYVWKHEFEIMNPDFPPHIPAGDWVEDPRNEEWKWCREKIMNDQGNGGGVTPDSIANATIKLMRENRPDLSSEEHSALTSQIVGLVKDNQEQMREYMDPTRQLQMFTGFLNIIPKPAAPAPDTQSGMLLQLLIDDRKAMREQIAELTKLVMTKKEKSALEQVEELEPLLDRLGKLGGKHKSEGDESLWAGVATRVVEELAPAVGEIAKGFFNQRRGFQVNAEVGQAPPLNGASQAQPTHPQTALQRRANPRPAAGAQAPASGSAAFDQLPQEAKQNMMQLLNKYGVIIQQTVPFLIDHYRAGLTGYDLRDWFISRHGLNWWTNLRAEVGVDNLVTFAKYDAELWKALQPEDKLRIFFAQFFVTPGEEPPDDEDEPDDDAGHTAPIPAEGK